MDCSIKVSKFKLNLAITFTFRLIIRILVAILIFYSQNPVLVILDFLYY